jgi:hypothetical protein
VHVFEYSQLSEIISADSYDDIISPSDGKNRSAISRRRGKNMCCLLLQLFWLDCEIAHRADRAVAGCSSLVHARRGRRNLIELVGERPR